MRAIHYYSSECPLFCSPANNLLWPHSTLDEGTSRLASTAAPCQQLFSSFGHQPFSLAVLWTPATIFFSGGGWVCLGIGRGALSGLLCLRMSSHISPRIKNTKMLRAFCVPVAPNFPNRSSSFLWTVSVGVIGVFRWHFFFIVFIVVIIIVVIATAHMLLQQDRELLFTKQSSTSEMKWDICCWKKEWWWWWRCWRWAPRRMPDLFFFFLKKGISSCRN